MQESFNRLLAQYAFLSAQIDKQTQMLRELSETVMYRERMKILQSIPGIGVISAMELLWNCRMSPAFDGQNIWRLTWV